MFYFNQSMNMFLFHLPHATKQNKNVNRRGRLTWPDAQKLRFALLSGDVLNNILKDKDSESNQCFGNDMVY